MACPISGLKTECEAPKFVRPYIQNVSKSSHCLLPRLIKLNVCSTGMYFVRYL